MNKRQIAELLLDWRMGGIDDADFARRLADISETTWRQVVTANVDGTVVRVRKGQVTCWKWDISVTNADDGEDFAYTLIGGEV